MCDGFITIRDLIVICKTEAGDDSPMPSADACPGSSSAQPGVCKKVPKPNGLLIWIEPSAACNSSTTIARAPPATPGETPGTTPGG
jgi:hypothetical protein